uniref:Cytochrome c biogenesis protein CcsA n=2 Tax=Membranoptera TaxID=158697 RepID=A0A1L1YA48_9FLOR|nr:cytochrome c heme attachment protein [Membranoptera weeksiae]YP_009332968.1 cytochrome c heme attachment protein [Membranoptera tenuis]AHZ94762.1 cytochrome c heme attachment protein [Membranoptera weeksiae]AKL79224.1 cytochrome c heme attachment protein [Membranoptera tenuis]
MSWNIIENNLINISFSLLLITFIIYWINLIIIKIEKLQNICNILTIIINICLSTSLLIRWVVNNYFPLSNLYESLIFLTWCITLIHIVLAKKSNSKLIGAIIAPISLFIIAFASISLPPSMKIATPLVPALRSNWLMMHVTVMMISYATLMIGSILSILFLIISNGKNIELQGNSYNYTKKILLKYNSNNSKNILSNNQIIDKNITYKYNRINLLESIDNLSYRIIGFGFPLLTIGIIAGAVWANEAWGSYWSWDPKETWALITWIIFATYLHSRLNKSWHGKKPAVLASIGFVIVWICYLGVNFLGKGLHSYGWIS